MKWKITDDLCNEDHQFKSAVGTGSGITDDKPLPFKFRLLDDDGEVYYLGESDDCNSQAAFTPLDWAEAYAGCTTIQFFRLGKWETL
jgi:hypothetical protein